MADAIDLCTRDDVRLALEIQATKTGRDPLIDDAITDASQRIMDYCEREFAPAGVAGVVRLFEVDLTPRSIVVDLSPYDLQVASAVVLHPELGSSAVTLTVGVDYTLEPVPSRWGTYYRMRLSPFVSRVSQFAVSFGTARISVTGTWGFPEVPSAARRACIVTVASWIDRRIGAYSPQDSSDGRSIMPDTTGGLDIPNSAKRMLEPLRRFYV